MIKLGTNRTPIEENAIRMKNLSLTLVLLSILTIASAQVTCGPGTYWSLDQQLCLPISECQEDLDSDGMIGIGDILILLSGYAETCEVTEEITCQNEVTFDGYNYQVVKIGNQCWFAENLRTTTYANGDQIHLQLSNEEWSIIPDGASAILWENSDYEFVIENPDTVSWALNRFGRLYNFHAVSDPRGICPVGWHVSTDEDWLILEELLGLPEEERMSMLGASRGSDINLGHKLKESLHWMNASNKTWDLTQYIGDGGTWGNIGYLAMNSRELGPPLLNLLGTGVRTNNGSYGSWGYSSHVWSPDGETIITRFTLGHWEALGRSNTAHVQSGYPIRCVRD